MNIIFTIHLILFISLFIIPFINNEKYLQMYGIIIPFLFYHWSVNNDTCALTQLEMYLTGENKDKTFMGRLVGPVYKMEDTAANNMLKTSLFTLWAFTQYRLGHLAWFEKNLSRTLKRIFR
jgi:hypothetical protein